MDISIGKRFEADKKIDYLDYIFRVAEGLRYLKILLKILLKGGGGIRADFGPMSEINFVVITI